jgi:hypothetical protein
MIHAREDYNRFQEPDELIEIIRKLYPLAQYDAELDEQLTSLLSAYDQTLALRKNPIGIDEPVMLFRAQDENFISVLRFYREEITSWSGYDLKIVDQINKHIELTENWKENNKTKQPDSI